jgi:alginate O-acetyltransferase complex protein AlgJ
MLFSYRRYFAALAFLLLSAPLVVGVVKPDSPASILREGRNLAPAPKMPASGEDWLTMSKQIDAYLLDHFGLRQVLIRTHKDLTKPLLAEGNESVLIGRDGRMFYLGEETVRQSAGLILRDRRVTNTADLLAEMKELLAARGIRFLVAVPPNAASIYQDDLPNWAQNLGKKTEYDVLLESLAARDVPAVDLRPVLRAARSKDSAYYLHDTHWTAAGALAAYNTVVEADSRPDWRLDPKSSLGPPIVRKGGDLARMFGVEGSVTEDSRDLDLSSGKKTLLSSDVFGDFMLASDKPGPTIMILGDSFTGGFFPPMALQHAGQVVWVHHRLCGFDWKAIDRFRPDEVWWMPNERFLVCGPDVRPLNFAG